MELHAMFLVSISLKVDMNKNHLNALKYITNTGGAPTIGWFDDDHEPIGQILRTALTRLGLIEIKNDVISLTVSGRDAIKQSLKG